MPGGNLGDGGSRFLGSGPFIKTTAANAPTAISPLCCRPPSTDIHPSGVAQSARVNSAPPRKTDARRFFHLPTTTKAAVSNKSEIPAWGLALLENNRRMKARLNDLAKQSKKIGQCLTDLQRDVDKLTAEANELDAQFTGLDASVQVLQHETTRRKAEIERIKEIHAFIMPVVRLHCVAAGKRKQEDYGEHEGEDNVCKRLRR
jgi:prefoldin subunit 5